MEKDTTLPLLLSQSQAAKIVGCDRKTLAKYSRIGVCPAGQKIGNRIMYPTAALFAWVQSLEKTQKTA